MHRIPLLHGSKLLTLSLLRILLPPSPSPLPLHLPLRTASANLRRPVHARHCIHNPLSPPIPTTAVTAPLSPSVPNPARCYPRRCPFASRFIPSYLFSIPLPFPAPFPWQTHCRSTPICHPRPPLPARLPRPSWSPDPLAQPSFSPPSLHAPLSIEPLLPPHSSSSPTIFASLCHPFHTLL